MDKNKVLIISPLKGIWQNIPKMFDPEKWQIITFEHCLKGREIVNNDSTIDLIIVNSYKTDNCGLNFLKWIKNDPRLKWLPVLMAGESFDEDTVREFLSLEADDIVLLPIQKETLEAKVQKALLNGKKTVLVVDDDVAIADILREFLILDRYNVIVTHNGEDALKIVKENKIDVVVSDIMMPGMSGTDLLVEVKSIYENIPFILITGFSGKYTPEECIAIGADGFFSKPFYNVDLSYTLSRVISQYHPQRPQARPHKEKQPV